MRDARSERNDDQNVVMVSTLMHTKSRKDYADSLQEIADLKAKLYKTESEISELRSELKETRALLGEAVVAANTQKYSSVGSKPIGKPQQVTPVGEPSRISNESVTRKRPRSPSIEVIEPSPKATKLETKSLDQREKSSHGDGKPLQGPRHPTKRPYIDVPPRKIGPPSRSARSTGKETAKLSANLNTSATEPKPLAKPAPKDLVKSPPPEASTSAKKDKMDVFTLPKSVIEHYLDPLHVKSLQISPPPSTLSVPREFLRLAYGGSDQHLIQYIEPARNPSGKYRRYMILPNIDLNPVMPSRPGAPGLLFASRTEILKIVPWSVFCKEESAKGKMAWRYLGEYKNELCGKMTAEQFRSQTPVVQREWAKLIIKKLGSEVYVAMRARIALRKEGSLPALNADLDAILEAKEIAAIKSKKGMPVDEDDIIEAFSRGDEGVNIIRMVCHKYDHVFADDIEARFPDLATLRADYQRTKAAKAAVTPLTRKAKSTSNKKGKARANADVDANSQPDEEMDDWEADSDV